MKRVACLVQMVAAIFCVGASNLLVGCEKPPEKLDIKDVHVEISGAPNVKIDGAGGIGLPQVDLSLLQDGTMMKKAYDANIAAMANAASSSAGGGADSGSTNTAETKPTDPGEVGLIGVWKTVKLDPEPASPDQKAELMKKGVEFKADHSFHILESGKPVAGEEGTWKLAEGAIEVAGAQLFEFKIEGKTLSLKQGGTSVIMEK